MGRKFLLGIAISVLGFFCPSCGRESDDSASTFEEEIRRNQLASIQVARGEVVMANEPAPVPLIDSPCQPPVVRGIGKYADVGWVGARFFVIRTTANPSGYELTELPEGGMRLTARFRAAQSEQEAVELDDGNTPRLEGPLFCRIGSTLRALRDTSIRRLALWPTDAIQARVQLTRVHDFTMDMSDWSTAHEVTASVVLNHSEGLTLLQDLRSNLGKQVQFDLFSTWRVTGCTQVIDLQGIEIQGLEDGEKGAVPLIELKRAIRQVKAQSTKVDITGECGQFSLINPPGPQDNGLAIMCTRIGDSVSCRYEGEFQNVPAVYTTFALLAEARGR